MKKYIYLIPILQLIATLISCFVDFNYVVVGNILGYSIFTNIILYICFNHKKYCWITRNSPLFMILINLIDILGVYIDYSTYKNLFTIIVVLIALFLGIIYELKRNLKNE